MSEPKGRVLLVEDDETTRNAMFRLLQIGGLDVVTAASVTEACQILKTIQPPPVSNQPRRKLGLP
ncbi:MAG TPA: response regulator [Tepidisphaeraceae bacterium]|nr:response regulator [Tepidisphaeraceae bacterium]